MPVQEVKINLVDDARNTLLAFANVLLSDGILIRDIKIIKGKTGSLFLSMPNRPCMDHCPNCKRRNIVLAHYCSFCGKKLDEKRYSSKPENAEKKPYMDMVHPISVPARDMIHVAVMEEYDKAVSLEGERMKEGFTTERLKPESDLRP